ncbi:MAG: pyrroline-5-carboxylate reductase [Anaerolineae bacterium]|nr:pyrroline-5-carboxylate reductase [Anaerolineae bacterium]
MLQNTNIAFIGSGTMAGAIIKVILDKKLIAPQNVAASEPRDERRRELADSYGITTTKDNSTAVKDKDIVVLSIKPQVMPIILEELHGQIPPRALVLSIAAGVPVSSIINGLGHKAVVRVMPNTPAQIGEAMSVWIASPAVSETQRKQAQTILQAMGQELQVHAEEYLDMATAVSGTGPTYVFLMMEAMVDAAVHLGFSRQDAKKLVVQTVLGSVLFAQQSNKHLAELRNMVTSPGGTSADAIYQLEKGSMRTVLSKAIWAAYQKSRLLASMVSTVNGPERPSLEE